MLSNVFSLGPPVGRDLEAVDWASTEIGAPDAWPGALRSMLRVLLTSSVAMGMAWGRDLTFFCNDAYRRDALGAKYPWALGRPAREVWGDVWSELGPRIATILGDGSATRDESLLLFQDRHGSREETYHTFSWSPLPDDDGRINGVLCVVAEDTLRVVSARRMATLRDTGRVLRGSRSVDQVLDRLGQRLDGNPDLPFTLVYLFDGEQDERGGAARAVRALAVGVPVDHPAAPAVLERDAPGGPTWPGWGLPDGGRVLQLGPLRTGLSTSAGGAGRAAPEHAVVVPLRDRPDGPPAGFVVTGVNPHRSVDDDLLTFVGLLAGQAAAALAAARSSDEGQRPAEALVELHRVKSAFVANVRHEFRTALALITGPAAELERRLASSGEAQLAGEAQAIQRNVLRLGTAVDAALDVSAAQPGVVLRAQERARHAEQAYRLLQDLQGYLLDVDHHAPLGVLTARYEPAGSGLRAGGDWYDAFTLPGGVLALSVGDVVGTGLPAAAVMGQLRSAVRVAALTSPSPAAVLDLVDEYAEHVPGAMCASTAFVRVEAGRALRWSSAGHLPPLLVEGGRARYLEGGRRPLLACRQRARSEGVLTDVAPTSLLLLYTDGLVERAGETLDAGLARLLDAVRAHEHLAVGALCDAVVSELRPDDGFRDDVGLVAVRTVGERPGRLVDAYGSTPSSLRTARHRFADWLRRSAPVEDEQLDDAVLAFAEATANALEHGNRSDPRRILGVEAIVLDGALSVVVTDSGEWSGDSASSRRLGRGRGFTIMRALTDDITIEQSRLGTTLSFRIDLGG